MRLIDLLIIVRNTSDMDTQFADKLIANLERDYDHIADHFSQTRHQPWPEFNLLEPLLTTNSSVLDVGCGNGRLAEFIKKIKGIDYTGNDLSNELLNHARSQYPEYTFVHGSMLTLPFQDSQFDTITCLAALQHIPSTQYRIAALREMYRVAKSGATLFMLNWNLYQEQLPNYFTAAQHEFGEQWETGDALVPWKNAQGEIQAQRYYHGFTVEEIHDLCTQTGWQGIQCALGESQRNIVTIATK